MAVTPPKTTADIAQGGGRHYTGRGLGTLTAWTCPACGEVQSGTFSVGCLKCGAGAPGVQVRKPGAPELGTSAPAPVPASRAPARQRPLADQLRNRPANVDYDEIERRVLRVLDARLGGGYTGPERVLLYQALEAFLWLIENNEIMLPPGQTAEQVRTLAQKVAPDEGLETETDAQSTTATTENTAAQATAQAGPSGEHAPGDDSGTDPDAPAIQHPAPEFLDADPGGDQGGQDDLDRDSF